MPGTNSRKHVVPLSSEASFTRATIFEQFGQSISDVVPVANVTERAQVVADLVADGVGPTSTRPVVVIRGDARGLHRVEYSYDGTTWLTASGVLSFSTKSAADSFGTANGGLLTIGDHAKINGREYAWSGAAWVGSALSLVKAATQSLTAGTETDITFSSAVVNDNFVASFPVSSITLAAGVYELSASIEVVQTAGNYFNLAAYVGGSQVAGVTGSPYPHVTSYSRATIAGKIFPATDGQALKFTALASTAGTITAGTAMVSLKRID